jgi:hypothetical protein
MKKFILRLLLFCLAPLPLLYLLQYVVDSGLKKSRYYYYSEWNDMFNGKINADMLILGSSRAWVQVSPKILDSTLHINSYNLGMDGASFKMQYARFKIYMRYNKKPKYILQEVGCTSTLVKTDILPASQQFLPYLDDSEVWHIVSTASNPLDYLDRYFPMYKYNNELPLVKEGILSYMGRGAKSTKYKGYEGQQKAWDSTFHDFLMANPKGMVFSIDPEAIALLREFLTYCHNNDIQVIMFYPPAFIQSVYYIANQKEILKVFNDLSEEFHVPFYNYMYDSLNYTRNNFYNSMHLNKHGSEVFTTMLADTLKERVR